MENKKDIEEDTTVPTFMMMSCTLRTIYVNFRLNSANSKHLYVHWHDVAIRLKNNVLLNFLKLTKKKFSESQKKNFQIEK